MSRRRGTNWDLVARREKGEPRRKQFREYSRDHRSINQWTFEPTKAELKKLLEEAAKNTALTSTDGTPR